MNILFYRYNSICEPAILRAFRQLNIHVIEIDAEMTNKKLEPSKCVALLSHEMDTHHPLFVFSINFFPAIAEVCAIYQTPYLCWTVDSPVPELFSKSITKATNRIFLFDKAQYEYFHPFHPTGTFHLPLASDIEHFDSVIASITEEDYTKYKNDICFIGSLYSEKNPFSQLSLPEYESGYVRGIMEASLNVYGYNFIEETITDDVIYAIKEGDTNFFSLPDTVTNPDRYIASHQYIGAQVTEMERIRTLNELAKHFDVTLYTRSNPNTLEHVHVYNGIETLSEMPKAFHLSKVNLNMTTRPIQTGLPLRIFDILGDSVK